jgi:hypothetical protein
MEFRIGWDYIRPADAKVSEPILQLQRKLEQFHSSCPHRAGVEGASLARRRALRFRSSMAMPRAFDVDRDAQCYTMPRS